MSAFVRPRLIPRDSDLGWTPYAWLVYLPMFFVHPVLRGTSVGGWVACVGGSLVFLVTYFRGHWVDGRRLLPIVLTQVTIGAIFSPVNTGAYIMFTYAASFAARLEATSEAVGWIVGITAVGFGAALAAHTPLYYWIGHGVFTPLIGAVCFHRAQVARATEKLRAAQSEIEHLAAVAERERIGRDLHDVLGHTLTLIVLKAELAAKLAKRNPERALAEIRDVERVSRLALDEVREAIRGYRPTLADELRRARRLLDTAGIAATVDVTVDADALRSHPGLEEVFALALREAVTNVARHSDGSRATIRVSDERSDESGAGVVLEVVDDGRGVNRPPGSGLRGMRERVEAVGGRMTVASGRGSRLTIAIPVRHERSLSTVAQVESA